MEKGLFAEFYGIYPNHNNKQIDLDSNDILQFLLH